MTFTGRRMMCRLWRRYAGVRHESPGHRYRWRQEFWRGRGRRTDQPLAWSGSPVSRTRRGGRRRRRGRRRVPPGTTRAPRRKHVVGLLLQVLLVMVMLLLVMVLLLLVMMVVVLLVLLLRRCRRRRLRRGRLAFGQVQGRVRIGSSRGRCCWLQLLRLRWRRLLLLLQLLLLHLHRTLTGWRRGRRSSIIRPHRRQYNLRAKLWS